MQTRNQLISSFGVNILLKVAGMLIGLYQLFWIVGQATEAQYQEYNLIGGYLSVLMLVVGFGIYAVLQKEWTNSRDAHYHAKLWTTLLIFRLILIVVGLCVALCIPLLDRTVSFSLTILFFIQSAVVLIDYNHFAVYSSRAQVWKFSVSDLVGKITSLLFLYLYFLHIRFDSNPVVHFVVAQLISVLISLCLDSIWNRKIAKFGVFDMHILKALLPNMFVLAISWMLMGVYSQTQPVVLKIFGHEGDINAFMLAFSLVNQAILAISILNTQLASSVKQYADTTSDRGLALKNFKRVGIVYLCVLILGYAALIVVGPFVLRVIDVQNKYNELSMVFLPVLGLFYIFNSFSGMLSYINLFYHQEKIQLRTILIQAIFSILGFAILVPPFGAWGVIWTMVIVSAIDVCALRLPLTVRLISKISH